MDAIILVGGQGTRLRPLTLTRHKSLVPVCNRPAIAYLFEWLARAEIERAVLAVGRDNDDLADAYPPGEAHGIQIDVVRESSRLESGGAIRNAVQAAGVAGRFLVLNGDVFVDFDLAAALRGHEERRADLTLALYPVSDPSSFGVAVVDTNDMVTGFVEKPPRGTAPGNLVNAGVWIFEPGLVAEIPPGPVRVEETLFPSLVARRRRVFGHRFEGLWSDFGTPARYLELNRQLAIRAGAGCVSEKATLAAGATVSASAVGERTLVDAGAAISDSVLWEDVHVGEGAVVEASILADGVSVGAGARLSGVVAGKGAVVAARALVPPGTIIEPGGRYDGSDD